MNEAQKARKELLCSGYAFDDEIAEKMAVAVDKVQELELQIETLKTVAAQDAKQIGSYFDRLQESSRLLAEERERCAKIAETMEPFPSGADASPLDSTERWMVGNMRKRIATAIREQTKK